MLAFESIVTHRVNTYLQTQIELKPDMYIHYIMRNIIHFFNFQTILKSL